MIIPNPRFFPWLGLQAKIRRREKPGQSTDSARKGSCSTDHSRSPCREALQAQLNVVLFWLLCHHAALSSAAAKQSSHEDNRRDDKSNLPAGWC